VCADRPLLVVNRTARRFMSGLTLKSPHCASGTIIHCCVLSSQAVHLQMQLVIVVVSGDGESALHRVCVVRATSTVNCCNPLQPLSWSLTDPDHPVATEGESRGCTREFQSPSRLHQASPRFNQLHLTLNTCKHRESLSGKCHTFPPTHVYSHTQDFLFSVNHL
jgi:hypothetical protein